LDFLPILATAAAEIAPAAVEGETSSGGLPQLNERYWPSQLFWLAVFFGGLYLLMANYFLPRIGATIEERRDRVADDLDQAAEFKSKAENAEAAYKQALADATAKAQAIAADTRARIGAEIAAQSAEADRKAAEGVAEAEARIQAMKADASRKVREAAIETTRAIVAALIDETPTAEAVAAAMPAPARAA
jgi:F-type H+-transporting ATPase subunit b